MQLAWTHTKNLYWRKTKFAWTHNGFFMDKQQNLLGYVTFTFWGHKKIIIITFLLVCVAED